MSWSDVAVAAVAVACFHLLGWCWTLARRLDHIERPTKTAPLGGDHAWLSMAAAAGDVEASDNISEPILDEPKAGRISDSPQLVPPMGAP